MGFEEFLKGLRHKASYTYLETSMALESFRFKSLQFKGFLSRLYKGSIRLRDTGFRSFRLEPVTSCGFPS